MKAELSTLQLTGIIMTIAGLLLSNGLLLYSGYIIKHKLKENTQKLAILRPFNIYFQLRKLIKGTSKGSDRKNYEKIGSFLNGSLIFSVAMIMAGILLAVLA
jgi:hypothetical protein